MTATFGLFGTGFYVNGEFNRHRIRSFSTSYQAD